MSHHLPDSESDSQGRFRLQLSRAEPETLAALGGTLVAVVLLVLTAVYAGPLWRDETNTANVAHMLSLHELWHNRTIESFPPLWPLLVRAGGALGLVDGDAGIRVLGLYVGLFFLGMLWLTGRWLRCRGPILSVALLGCLPTFIFIVGANRAYGLACGLLALSFGTIWRVVERPSAGRVLWAGLACLLFTQCVYYDAVYLAAMLAGGALVVLRRRRWPALAALVGIGSVSVASLTIYASMFKRETPTAHLFEYPYFSFWTLWAQLRDTVTARSSGEIGRNGPEIWLWLALLLAGVVVALAVQRTRRTPVPEPGAVEARRHRADLALYCAVAMVLAVVGLFVFMLRLHYLTQSWYYVEMLCLCTIALDGLLGATSPALRPWGLLRVGFMVAMMAWGVRAGSAEAHTRRSDLDLIAAVLNKNASSRDLIIAPVWEGITFNRYYHGPARWMTVPPIESHLVHRTDLVWEKMDQESNQQQPMAPVLLAITNTLRGGNTVWLVGSLSASFPRPVSSASAGQWFGTYLNYWNGLVSTCVTDNALQEQTVDIPLARPVCYLENLPLLRFWGDKAATNQPAWGQ